MGQTIHHTSRNRKRSRYKTRTHPITTTKVEHKRKTTAGSVDNKTRQLNTTARKKNGRKQQMQAKRALRTGMPEKNEHQPKKYKLP